MQTLPDTRPYPATPIRKELLVLIEQLQHATTQAQRTLISETLQTRIRTMLAQKQYLTLSTALMMVNRPQDYLALIDALDQVLRAETHTELQWLALPVVIVAGSDQHAVLSNHTPINALRHFFQQHEEWQALADATFLPKLVRSDDFAQIKPDVWYQAKQNTEQAQQFADRLPARAINVPPESSVHVVYALAYTHAPIQPLLGKPWATLALPLMQLWQQHLNQQGLTLFTNPLNLNTPIQALGDASHMRKRMALDVFSTNAIRAIRLKNATVGSVMAGQEGGKILFGFSEKDNRQAPVEVFSWALSAQENIASIQQNFVDLLNDCQVQDWLILPEALPEHASLPNYQQALEP